MDTNEIKKASKADAIKAEMVERHRALQGLRNSTKRSYPFCGTDACPYWRGYCRRDPACNN